MEFVNFRGQMDLFAVPSSLFASKKKAYFGSVIGSVLSVVCIVILFSFSSFLVQRMYNYEEDSYTSNETANDHSDEKYSLLKLKDFNFMLSFKIELLDNSPETRKFVDDNKEDFDIFD